MCVTNDHQPTNCSCSPYGKRRILTEGVTGDNNKTWKTPRMVPRGRWFALRPLDGSIDPEWIEIECDSKLLRIENRIVHTPRPEVLLLVPPPSTGEANARLCTLRFSVRMERPFSRTRVEEISWPVHLVHRVKIKGPGRSGRFRWWPPEPGSADDSEWLEASPSPPPDPGRCP